MHDKELIIDGKKLKLSIERFDEDIDLEHGASYHGFSYKIESSEFLLWFKKYDEDGDVGFVSEPKIETELVGSIIRKVLNEDVSIYSLKDVK